MRGGLEQLFSFPDMLKAVPATEGDQRVIYLEASNEARDYQGEQVLAKALAASADYFERYGNFDIQHRSMIGLASGDPDYHLHEIGRPEKVRVDSGRTFVKGIVFSGEGRVAEAANNFWDSLTRLNPPQRWYPSVGGKIQEVKKAIDPESGQPTRQITKVIWSNVGFSRTPVNPRVPQVSTVPIGTLAKCMTEDGIDFQKALEAGYGTDSATLAGGAALRRQSLDGAPQDYWEFRNRLAAAVLKGGVATREHMLMRAREMGLDDQQASAWTNDFAADVKNLMRRNRHAR